MKWFIADLHFGHSNIVKYCNRPFKDVMEMDDTIINNWNSVVNSQDTVYVIGDFCFGNASYYIEKLKGNKVFLAGSHDKDLYKLGLIKHEIWNLKEENETIILCHYCMRVWHKSHFNSWHLFGHSHGRLVPEGKSMDVGVDCNNFYPISLDRIREIMKDKPDNSNFLGNKNNIENNYQGEKEE
jgi:calcineurin-like phosphoesterase family protein